MSRWRYLTIGLSLTAIFTAGLVIGGVLALGWVKREADNRRNPANWTPRTIAWLDQELNLTPAQKETIRPGVEAAMKELTSVQENTRQESGRIAYGMLDRIAPALSPAQQEQFKELRKKRTEAWLLRNAAK
jgi:Spy/CpxP family protein refolding chaperone